MKHRYEVRNFSLNLIRSRLAWDSQALRTSISTWKHRFKLAYFTFDSETNVFCEQKTVSKLKIMLNVISYGFQFRLISPSWFRYGQVNGDVSKLIFISKLFRVSNSMDVFQRWLMFPSLTFFPRLTFQINLNRNLQYISRLSGRTGNGPLKWSISSLVFSVVFRNFSISIVCSRLFMYFHEIILTYRV